MVLIVGGALAAALLVIDAGHKTGAIEISQAVGQGQKIPLSSMQEVQLTSGTGIAYVPWNEASQVARTYAATMIPAGTLLTPQMTTPVNNLASGRTVVGLALKEGELPGALQVGDHVDIYETSDAQGRCPRPTDNLLSADAVVLNISRPAGTSSDAVEDVQVGVNPPDASGVSCNAANDNVGVGILQGTGGSAAATGPSSAPSSSASPSSAASPGATSSTAPSRPRGSGSPSPRRTH